MSVAPSRPAVGSKAPSPHALGGRRTILSRKGPGPRFERAAVATALPVAFGYGPKTLDRLLGLDRALRPVRTGVPFAEVALRAGYHAIMRPVWDQLERPGSAARVWRASDRRFVGNVLGPHFEQVCRDWALHHADPDILGGLPARVGHGVVHDTRNRTGHEVDLAVIGVADGAKPPLLAIGEAKWNDVIGIAHIERLRHIRELIARTGRYDTHHTRLICLTGAHFNDKARAASHDSPDIQLVDLPTLYRQA